LSATSTLPVALSGVTALLNALGGIAGATQKLAIVEAIVAAGRDRPDVIEITPDAVASRRLAHPA
jgi:hypothetical protein